MTRHESAITRACMDRLYLIGFSVPRVVGRETVWTPGRLGRVWRQNTGAARVIGAGGRERLMRFGVPGIADIIGWTDLGRFLAIETKNPAARGKLSPLQVEWGNSMLDAGGVYIVAHSADEMVERLIERNVISREAAA